MSTIPYRPHIDGLRGLAILAVVLYHAKLFGVSGGYVGVDVFFVISGFLIASVVIRSIRSGTFSIAGFWERRVRRLVPALIVVLFCTTVAAHYLLLYPQDYHDYGGALISQSLFASNFFFMQTDSYFDQSSKYSPLLHLWTLSVEEQFYLFFPLAILFFVWLASRYSVALAKKRRIVILGITVLSITSFLMSVWLVNVRPTAPFSNFLPYDFFANTSFATAAFYLLPTRIWEFALGIVIALTAVKIPSKRLAEALGLAGIAAIAVSIFLFNDDTFFPGIAALIPTLGAAAVILAGEHHRTISSKLLSLPAVVSLGLISYSLYLWHWPIFVFAQTLRPGAWSLCAMLGLITLSIAVAWLSYRYVETPFRKMTIARSRKTIFLFAFALMTIIALSGYAIRSSLVPSAHVPRAASEMLNVANEWSAREGECYQLATDAGQYSGLCRIGNEKWRNPNFVLWGDSHADALSPLFVALARAYGVQGAILSTPWCIPIAGVNQARPIAGCEHKNEQALAYIRSHNIKNIFIVARWSYYVMGGPDAVHSAFLRDSDSISRSPAESEQVFERNLGRMLEDLAQEGRTVYILRQVPEQFGFNIRDMFYQAVRAPDDLNTGGISLMKSDAYQSRANRGLDIVAKQREVFVLNPNTILCSKASCDLRRSGGLLYRDDNHLSVAGAMLLEPLLTPAFVSMHRNLYVEAK